jgi:hypothetical protein
MRAIANNDLPEKQAQKGGVKAAQKDIPIGCAACKGIPQDHTHAAAAPCLLLFLGNHSPEATAQVFPFLNLVRDSKNELSNPVVSADTLTCGPVVTAKILRRDAGEDRSFGCGLGGAVGSTDAVFVQSRYSAIPNENHAIREGVAGTGNI